MSNSDMSVMARRRLSLPWIVAAILLAAMLAWLAIGIWLDARRAWAMLLTDFLFLTPLSAGLVVWPAIVVVSRGQWMGSTQRTALAGIVLLPACILILIVLFTGVRHWAPWLGRDLPNSWWLNGPSLFARDMVSLLVFSGLAWWFVRAMKRGQQPRRLGAWLIFIYSIAFSILGIDLVMALSPRWYSVVFGMYFFISGLYIAIAGWLFISAAIDGNTKPSQLADQSGLVITFSLLTTYMMYCQLLPIWYENMPAETNYLVPRMNWVTGWPGITIVLLAVVYIGPLVLLLRSGARSSPTYTTAVAALILTGLWLERWWLVMPSLDEPLAFGPSEMVGVVALVATLAMFVIWLRRRVILQRPDERAATEAGGTGL